MTRICRAQIKLKKICLQVRFENTILSVYRAIILRQKRNSRKRTINGELKANNFENISDQYYPKFPIATMEGNSMG